MGPVPSSCLSYFFFLKPQTDGFTVKIRAKKDKDAGNQLEESLWPSGMKPFNCVFQETKQINLTHTHKVVHRTTIKSLMAESRKGSTASLTALGLKEPKSDSVLVLSQQLCASSQRGRPSGRREEAGRRPCLMQLCLFQNGAGTRFVAYFFAEFGFVVQSPSPD